MCLLLKRWSDEYSAFRDDDADADDDDRGLDLHLADRSLSYSKA